SWSTPGTSRLPPRSESENSRSDMTPLYVPLPLCCRRVAHPTGTSSHRSALRDSGSYDASSLSTRGCENVQHVVWHRSPRGAVVLGKAPGKYSLTSHSAACGTALLTAGDNPCDISSGSGPVWQASTRTSTPQVSCNS